LVFKIRALLNTFGFFFNQEWVFVADTTRRISDGNMDRNEKNLINFTFDGFQWENFSVIYLYGITKFVFGEDLVEVSRENVENPLIGLNDQYHVSKDIDRIFKPRTPLSLLFPDIDVVLSRFQMHPRKPFSNVALVDMKSLIMNSKVVQEAIKEKAKEQNLSIPIVSKEAEGIISKMVGDVDPKVLMGMAVALRKAFKVLFTNVYVNEKGIEALRRNLSKGPVIYLPTHRSYLDFLIISYVCFLYGLPVPFIAAGEDFLGMFLVRSLFRFSGAFFLRRSFSGDKLYSTIFGEYVKQLLVNGHSLEFFIEGTRSRSGKMLHPKMGLLNDVTQVYLDGGIPNAVVCPITINFEKTVEGELYKNELLGDRKVKESLSNLLKSLPNLFANLGRISIHFSENPFDLEGYVKSYTQGQKSLLISDAASRMTFNEHLAYKVVYELCNNVEVMPTHIVASLLLMYRQGITKNQLIQKSDWLRGEILKRNGKIAFIEGSSWPSIVTKALYHLRNLVIERRQNVYEPINDQRVEYRNMLLLGHYRNKLVHLFFEEAIWACAFYSFGEKVIENGVTKEELIVEAKFLYELLEREVINRPEPNPVFDVDKGLEMMINRGVFNIRSDGKIHVPHSGETLFSFLISIGWPFIDSYYVTAMALFSLQPAREIDYSRLLSRAQWLATTLYHESRLCFYESCSIDTLQNSIYTFAKWGILKVSREAKKTKKDEKTVLVYSTLVKLLPPYQDDQVLQNLVSHIHKLCKPPPIRKNATRRAMIADIPILAKL
jgi:glycerone phosphate O-acyltransferase/fatty acyl-CoA reductase